MGGGQLTTYGILTTLHHRPHTHTHLYVVSISMLCVLKLVRREELDTANTLSGILPIDLSAFSNSIPGMSTASFSCRTCGRGVHMCEVCVWEVCM